MQKIHFSKIINAPIAKVWDTMLQDSTYREWTTPFSGSSHYEGDWSEGSEILFMSDAKGLEKTGMYSRIRENRLHEFISIEHLGLISNGVVDTTSEEVKKWVPAFENYTFKATPEGTEVSVDMDINSEYKEAFDDMWPRALALLKEISERQ